MAVKTRSRSVSARSVCTDWPVCRDSTASISARGQGAIPDLILQADEVVRLRAEMESVLSLHTGQSVDTLRADTDRDRVFTAAAALEYGLIDQVITGRD